MRKPDHADYTEIAAVAWPIALAQAVVAIALFIGAAIVISDRTLWGIVIEAVWGWS